jgi:uncharacterized peroxidase-related enzyme
MSFIKVIPPSEAEGKLEKIYQLVKGPGGQVDQVLQIHSLRPHSLEGHMALYKAVLHHTGNQLPKWFLEAVGVRVSRLNRCDYCDLHHSAGLKRLLRDKGDFEAYDRALGLDSPADPFTAAEQAALAYVEQLTVSPGSIRQSDVDSLRSAGYSDGEILEINQVTAYFAYANRTVTGLGVDTEGEKLGLAPSDGEGKEGWRHD